MKESTSATLVILAMLSLLAGGLIAREEIVIARQTIELRRLDAQVARQRDELSAERCKAVLAARRMENPRDAACEVLALAAAHRAEVIDCLGIPEARFAWFEREVQALGGCR